MYDGQSSILDQVKFVHGPCDLLARYIALADETMREVGVRLRISRDFHRLMSLNTQHRDSWPASLPLFNPSYCMLTEDNALWIEGVDEQGDTVVTSAGRHYNFADRSVASELRSLRIFYDQPAPFVAAGGHVDVVAESASQISGQSLYSGAVWVRPDYRRHGFTRIIPRVMRSCAMAQWNMPTFWMMITSQLDRGGLTHAYGPWEVEPRVIMNLPTSDREIDLLFCWMSRVTMTRDIENAVANYDATRETSRWIDKPMTNSSLLVRQGSRTRS
jgi:hypothetical protein